MKNNWPTNDNLIYDKFVVFDFSNLSLQENSKDNCFGCDSCDSSCDSSDSCDCDCDSKW